MNIYINGLGNLSAQLTYNNSLFLNEINTSSSNQLRIIEPPSYKEYINTIALRRMSRIIKLGVSAAKICLNDANIILPDSIITGTGLGCLDDTEIFLNSILENQENTLNPAPFIQSTHNSISSQIAVILKCYGYNTTYSHRYFSFETALLDSILLINNNEARNILVGGVDEIINSVYKIFLKLGLLKKSMSNISDIYNSNTKGFILGEAATYFLLSNKPTDNTYCILKDLKTIYTANYQVDIQNIINSFLSVNDININDIDLYIIGNNGDKDNVIYYKYFDTLASNKIIKYKHLSGEFFTSITFAFWLAAKIFKEQIIPDILFLHNPEFSFNKNKIIKNILIYNNTNNIYHSLILLNSYE